MSNINVEQLEKLLAEGKQEEVKNLLQDYLSQDLSEADKGSTYLNLASIYMQVVNKFNKRYLDSLNNAIEAIKDINREGQVIDDKAALSIARAKIKAS
ncbi:MAG: hypothetical protein PHV78_03035 [Patescibacteria group bacterium]|nr:hypothetical protein [Patescibacteria group bacterium]MDD5121640.1 hypothetical protein [Patescibacteria group bacterium]MDD5221906.1 hypothetical protein [Patescibacteria group bacterium]MDD5396196.1 hypothetical protein [Patescibacteria group bacterium]